MTGSLLPIVTVPALTERYTDTANGFALQYPDDWVIGKGWSTTGYQCGACPTLQPASTPLVLTPFSGQALLTFQRIAPAGGMSQTLNRLMQSPGPGQALGSGDRLVPYAQHNDTINGQAVARLDTTDAFGGINHVLVVPDGQQWLVVRGQGDGRVFDAIVGTLKRAGAN